MAAAAAMLSIGLTAACSPARAPTPLPSAKASPTAMPTAAKRVVLGKGKFSAALSVPALLMRLPGEDQLRAATWDLSASGYTGATVGESPFSQSPDGRFYATREAFYDRAGAMVGNYPWPGKGAFSVTWSSAGNLCRIEPLTPVTGSSLVLQTAAPGQPARTVGQPFGIYSDNASYPVLACDEGNDVAIAASMGQGVATSRIWVMQLSSGRILRTYGYAQLNALVYASRDGSLLSEAVGNETTSTWTTTIGKTDGSKLATIKDFIGHGFSSDSSLLVGFNKSKTAVIEWKTRREVWSIPDPQYGGMLAEPGGSRIAVGLGFGGGSERRDVYIVSPDGSASLLPAEISIFLPY